MLEAITVLGLRGFAAPQTLRIAKPNGTRASGLTVIVGPNNAGKSTVIEALRALTQTTTPSFTQGRRNLSAGDKIDIAATLDDGSITQIVSEEPGTSESRRVGAVLSRVLVLPSRRAFSPFFSRSESARDTYMQQMGFPPIRASSVDSFSYRLFRAQRNRAAFERELAKVLDPVPRWSIDQHDNGQYFLKLTRDDAVHSSEGLGDGLISLLFIVDALYDSEAGDTIAIDEPELSLHPALARRLAALIGEYAADRQIILATHSPYFIDLPALENGATVARVHLHAGRSVLSQLRPETATAVGGLLRNENNPHILGLNAQEVFFLDERVVLVEGQEDVIFHKKVEEAVGVSLNGSVYGWGVGGADNMRHIAAILHDLGFRRVVGILDANKTRLLGPLRERFPDFFFEAIPADDLRSKPPAAARGAVAGILDDENRAVRPEYHEPVAALFARANAYFNRRLTNAEADG